MIVGKLSMRDFLCFTVNILLTTLGSKRVATGNSLKGSPEAEA